MDEGAGDALVSYIPFHDTPYTVSLRAQGSVEIVFHTLADATAFFQAATSSGCIDQATLYKRTPGCFLERGLVDHWDHYSKESEET